MNVEHRVLAIEKIFYSLDFLYLFFFVVKIKDEKTSKLDFMFYLKIYCSHYCKY